MMGAVSEHQLLLAEPYRNRLPAVFFESAPKISKGDKYLDMPWLVLDFPRSFQMEQMLAIRQFFWWGNLFSSSLLVSGSYKEELLTKDWKQWHDLFICVHTSPWEHHFGADNFRLIGELSNDELDQLCQQEFLKLAFMVPILDWPTAPDFYNQSFSRWMQLLVRP